MLMKMTVTLLVCLMVLTVPVIASATDSKIQEVKNERNEVMSREEYLMKGFNWISNKFFGVIESFINDDRTGKTDVVDGRKHKKKKMKLNKYVLPMIVGFLLIKSVLLPLALKALAVLSGKAVVLSLMSLILAAIIGLRGLVGGGGGIPLTSKVDLVNLPLSKYRRKDLLEQADQIVEEDPYRYYSERRRRRKK